MKKAAIVFLALLLLAGLCWFFLPGLFPRADVHLLDFAAPAHGKDLTVTVGISSSVGYTRGWKDVSDHPQEMKLQFYSAFGGVNGTFGAENRYVIPLDEVCTRILFYRDGIWQEELVKDQAGRWISAREKEQS